jgi:hypothetical protein
MWVSRVNQRTSAADKSFKAVPGLCTDITQQHSLLLQSPQEQNPYLEQQPAVFCVGPVLCAASPHEGLADQLTIVVQRLTRVTLSQGALRQTPEHTHIHRCGATFTSKVGATFTSKLSVATRHPSGNTHIHTPC